jgi:hypothetical protein
MNLAFSLTTFLIVRGSTLWILALAHVRRKPEYWIEREKPATRPISKD